MKPQVRYFIPGKDSLKAFDCGKSDLNNFLLETGDAYLDAENFYSKCIFSPLVIPEPDDETVLMFFDLMSMKE